MSKEADHWSKHSRYDHVFVILRRDRSVDDDAVAERITVKKVVLSEERAEAEVRRLNELNAHRGSHYFWEIAQFDTSARGGGGVQAAE